MFLSRILTTSLIGALATVATAINTSQAQTFQPYPAMQQQYPSWTPPTRFAPQVQMPPRSVQSSYGRWNPHAINPAAQIPQYRGQPRYRYAEQNEADDSIIDDNAGIDGDDQSLDNGLGKDVDDWSNGADPSSGGSPSGFPTPNMQGLKINGQGMFSGKPYSIEFTVQNGQRGYLYLYKGWLSGRDHSIFVPVK